MEGCLQARSGPEEATSLRSSLKKVVAELVLSEKRRRGYTNRG